MGLASMFNIQLHLGPSWRTSPGVGEGEAFIGLNKSGWWVPLWCRGLRVQCCPFSGSGCCYDAGLIPGWGTSSCCRCGQKNKQKTTNRLIIPTLARGEKIRQRWQSRVPSISWALILSYCAWFLFSKPWITLRSWLVILSLLDKRGNWGVESLSYPSSPG